MARERRRKEKVMEPVDGRRPVEFTIITGLSGAGKTMALKALEDRGFFCVDNLPPALIPTFAELCSRSTQRVERVALVSDIRGGEFFDELTHALDELVKKGFRYRILFLEASDEVLLRRFKETRRPHPLATGGISLLEAIKLEREKLAELREKADKIIDTSHSTPAQLRREIEQYFVEGGPNGLTISIISFGFKYGLPPDADLVFDVRFLTNPNYVPSLKPLDGRHPKVKEHVLSHRTTKAFMRRLLDLLDFSLPHYVKEGKRFLSIAVGCTGGKHRSVVIAEELALRLRAKNFSVLVQHRDLGKE